ncbi:MAG TPA: glycosyl transferase [Spongiibacteraceae bacterium]|nr:glycosyl transferase [Spongiibacteraceae bacterium]HCS28612.1 glycosyl transferase [Spongiibacteraceae bacterium]|tara:strand:- start:770 stop:1648 length:879 start_codon:yes stop_codon:yes gene_type:complete
MAGPEHAPHPVVTIVVSCYNHADYIEVCIDSILGQDYPAIELLTYDDGSSDNSAAILQRLSVQHGFSFTAQQNKGLSATLNDALSKASGKYFCPIGSDDILMLDKSSKQAAYMEAHPDVAVCAGNAVLIDKYGQLINKRNRFHPARDLDFEEVFTASTPGFISPTAMIRTETLRTIGGYRSDIPLEDLYLWLKLSFAGHRIHVLNDLTLYYRKHDNNTYKNTAFMLDSIYRTLNEYHDHPLYPRVMGNELNSLLLTAAKQKDRKTALATLKRLSFSQYSRKTLRALLRLALP